MNKKEIGFVVGTLGFLSFWIGPNWLTLILLVIASILLLFNKTK